MNLDYPFSFDDRGRTATTDEHARRWFRRYWTFGIGSGAHLLVNDLRLEFYLSLKSLSTRHLQWDLDLPRPAARVEFERFGLGIFDVALGHGAAG